MGKREYLVGGRFTLADLTLASVLGHGYAKFMDKEWRAKVSATRSDRRFGADVGLQYPKAYAYFQRIIKDPKVKGAFGEPEIVDKTPEYKPKV